MSTKNKAIHCISSVNLELLYRLYRLIWLFLKICSHWILFFDCLQRNITMAELSIINKSIRLPICRICLQCEPDGLIEPCDCQGTTSKVHKNCLEFSLIGLRSLRCEICSFNYKIEMVPKYRLCESIRIWTKERLLSMLNLLLLLIIIYFSAGLLFVVAWIFDKKKPEVFFCWCIFALCPSFISTISVAIIFYLDWNAWKRFQMKIFLIPRGVIRNGIEINVERNV